MNKMLYFGKGKTLYAESFSQEFHRLVGEKWLLEAFFSKSCVEDFLT